MVFNSKCNISKPYNPKQFNNINIYSKGFKQYGKLLKAREGIFYKKYT